MAAFLKKNHSTLILAGIIILATGVRLWGITYGLPCPYCRPDEDRLIATALRLSPRDLNPHLFDWPGLFFYLARGILEVTGLLVGWWRGASASSSLILYHLNPTPFHIAVRLVFAGFGIASVFLLFLLGKRMFGRATGLLAAFFLTLSFLHARESHFGMLDVPVTFFSLLFFLRALKLLRLGRWRDYLGCGLWAGLAFATKYYAIVLLVPLLTAHLLRVWGKGWQGCLSRRAGAAVLLTFIIFLIVSPYTLLDFHSFYRDVSVKWIDQYYRGHLPIPEVRTMRGWLYHLVFSLRYALGWPLEALCLLGVAWSVYLAFRGRSTHRIILSFLIPFYLLLGRQRICFIRYVMMLLPYLCLLGAVFFRQSWKVLLPAKLRRLGAVVVILLVADPAARIVKHNILITRPDTRLTSSTWLKERIPKNTGLLFPNPLVFGRPWASFRYPNRVSLPRKATRRIWREFLSSPPAGLEIVIIDEHPLAYSSLDPKVITLLDERADLVYRLDAERPNRPQAIYDPYDAYYVPLAGFNRIKAPGPSIKIYRLP